MHTYPPILCGANEDEGLVAIEHVPRRSAADEMDLFFRSGAAVTSRREPFHSFLVAGSEALAGCPVPHQARELEGGGDLNQLALFVTWKDFLAARKWLAQAAGTSPSAPEAPCYSINDPIQQHLMLSGRTMFRGLRFEGVRRMQVDIECFTSAGYEFCNAEREGDRIIAIAVGTPDGGETVLSGAELSERELLERLVALVREHDPDIIEGHNIFNFDLPYLAERARRHGVKLALGRDGSVAKRRPSRMSIGDRVLAYERFEIFGRHVVDTFFLVQAYDLVHRSLGGFGLKEVAVHFGFASPERTYIDGADIAREFLRAPGRVMDYVRDDIRETRAVGRLLSQSMFAQAQFVPFSYQNVCVRGNAAKIDALMVREYLRQGAALPLPGQPREFAGGYTDMFVQGVVENVHHGDIRSMYPSLMLTRKLAPQSDRLGVFLRLLGTLREYRLQARQAWRAAGSSAEKDHYDALQGTFKILINSFYGYLGFAQGRFNDYTAAEHVTRDGRALLRDMLKWLAEHGAQPVESDTDGIYFVPPPGLSAAGLDAFRKAFAASLPEGLEIEFDGEYKAMFSYKMKNYALLTHDGEVIIKGAALKSRGLEPFQREFLKELLRCKLENRPDDIVRLKARFEEAIRAGAWPIRMLAKTETLQDSPAAYSTKRQKGKGARRAVYELALASGREYRAGDQVSYYVTGAKKSVAVHERAKLVSDWDPDNRDENISYYLDKLDSLYDKFRELPKQTELELETSDDENVS